MKSCNQILYLETRKHLDLYMYIGRSPLGPSAKFHVVNVHTTDELKLTGNCMLGSRPLLNFDTGFDSQPHLQVIKGLLTGIHHHYYHHYHHHYHYHHYHHYHYHYYHYYHYHY